MVWMPFQMIVGCSSPAPVERGGRRSPHNAGRLAVREDTPAPTDGGHVPVLMDAVLEALDTAPERRLLDGTFGGGGHTRALLDRGHHVLAIDCDPDAEARAAALQATYGERFRFRSGNFADLAELVGEELFDGILFDFGLSSFHYDTAERGFSFRHDGPLDMRLDPRRGPTAAEFLANASHGELAQAIRIFGEEPQWRRIVEAILETRESAPLRRTVDLTRLVEAVVSRRPGPPSKIHPATRTFQGIRIAVNAELQVIEAVLPQAFAALRPGGRLAAISFHSLEDRLVKRFFRRMAGQPEHDRDARPQQERVCQARLLTRRPIEATEAEISANPRSRSAKLRVLEKPHSTQTENHDPSHPPSRF